MLVLSPDAEAGGTSKELEKCIDRIDLSAMKNSQFHGCYNEELQRQDKRLNDAYRVAMSKAPPEIKQKLVEAQRAWLLYRDSWCGYVRHIENAPNGLLNREMCLAELTAAQADQLKGNVFYADTQ
jgi:uncharacterized protein YecT (DUF1311 family)